VSLLFYVLLIGFTAGTLVTLFLLALIVGHRRPRSFERVLFFLLLALFLFYAGGLLIFNTQMHYVLPPAATWLFGMGLIAGGLALLPPLLLHAHVAYERVMVREALPAWLAAVAWVGYLPLLFFPWDVFPRIIRASSLEVLWPGSREAHLYGFWLGAVLVACVPFELASAKRTQEATRHLHRFLAFFCLLVGAGVIYLYGIGGPENAVWSEALGTFVVLSPVVPCAALGYTILRHNFLEIGLQKNLIYAVTTTFVALMYIALVWRLSRWFEPILPPEATASILIFILVILYEPLERGIGRALHRSLRERVDRLQRLTVELQEQARHGDVAHLIARAEERIREEFGLAAARISIPRDPARKLFKAPGGLGHVFQIPLKKDRKDVGLLEAASTGSYLTGETTAALEFLADQLPAMVELSRLIEEKLRLERELAERERLALLGQMAASVSHNLRNPLGSMKTVLQVQLENPELPLDVRQDCALVLGEVDRMSAKLTQLLHFAKPSTNGRRADAIALARQTAALFRHDAEARNVRLEFDCPEGGIFLLASEEALSEVLSNLILNAIEAQPNGGRVRLGFACSSGSLEVIVEDDGPGVAPEVHSKIFQPFFTTKATGTGLGLSIVARRVAEMGGTITCESPVRDAKGTQFRLTLPLPEGNEVGDHADNSDHRR
jgi:signal transduction histidine kinase